LDVTSMSTEMIKTGSAKRKVIFVDLVDSKGLPLSIGAAKASHESLGAGSANSENVLEDTNEQGEDAEKIEEDTGFPLVPPDVYALVVREKGARIYLRSVSKEDKERAHILLVSAKWKYTAITATVVHHEDSNENCLVVVDNTYTIHVYALMDLSDIASLPPPSTSGGINKYQLSHDGTAFVFTSEGVTKFSIFAAELKPIPPSLYVPGVPTPQVPKQVGLLKSLFGKPAVNLDDLFKGEPVLHSQPQQSQPQQQQESSPTTRSKTVQEIKAKYGRETKNVGDAMAQTRQALQDRGEKLNEVQDKSERMENLSKDFLANIKELRKKQEESWF